ncbi:hypothetical protein, partial [Agrobacterium pusense]|uniref:hypothetical protein n=1 Tax=Agrobacterium pusense TaxID=648995 RepID=UPI0013003745
MADFIKDGLNACPDGFFFDRLFCLLMSLKLIVNPPDILWLPVDKHRSPGSAAWIEKRSSYCGKVVVHLNIGDDIASL